MERIQIGAGRSGKVKAEEEKEKERSGTLNSKGMEREKNDLVVGLSKSEIQVLKMMRTGKYISIKLVIKNGEIDTIEGLERLDTKERIIDVLKQHDFQNIEIKKSHGKIVCVNRVFRQKVNPHENASVVNKH